MKLISFLGRGLLVAGLGFLALAVWLAHGQRRLESAGQRAPGSVVDIARHAPRTVREGTGIYCAVVGFTPSGGAPMTFESKFCGNSSRHHRGESVTVLYDPAQPANARIDDFASDWGISLLTAGFGFLALFSGLGVSAWGSRLRRPAAGTPAGTAMT